MVTITHFDCPMHLITGMVAGVVVGVRIPRTSLPDPLHSPTRGLINYWLTTPKQINMILHAFYGGRSLLKKERIENKSNTRTAHHELVASIPFFT